MSLDYHAAELNALKHVIRRYEKSANEQADEEELKAHSRSHSRLPSIDFEAMRQAKRLPDEAEIKSNWFPFWSTDPARIPYLSLGGVYFFHYYR
jgi:hypothetical protein